ENARPGVYLAKLVEGEDGEPLDQPSPAALSGKAQTLFVVRTPAAQAAPILYKLALATYQAYNFTGGGSLYHVAKDHAGKPRFDLMQRPEPMHERPVGLKVSLLRPGNGTGGDAWHQEIDPYDRGSARNTFEHWDAPFISFLEQAGYQVDYCVDLDVHQDANLLKPYRLLICAGHDEYWSAQQRRNTESFLQAGGNVAFFTGNTCWWRVHYVDGDTAMVCDKRGHDEWHRTEPEDSLTGVSYRHAGGWWQSRRVTLGYTVQFADHWVYAGTGLREGSVFGADPDQPLVGYECDGTPYTRDGTGRAVPAYKAKCGTPPGFVILGVAELSKAWPSRYGQGATMGVFSVAGGGTVFNAATTDWAKLLDRDEAVAQITHNVVRRLSGAG
ncbi:MAG TPA: N,N-dimethylformamidase beta subunit family domain-containing protein, partial [Polyangiales bacterium]